MVIFHQCGSSTPCHTRRTYSCIQPSYSFPSDQIQISLQLQTGDGRVWMSFGLGVTSCRLPGRFSSGILYWWVGEEHSGDLSFCISSYACMVFWCFMFMYIASILWKIVQYSLLSLCMAHLLLKISTFTTPVHEFLFWILC